MGPSAPWLIPQWEKVPGIRVLRCSWLPFQVGRQGPCARLPSGCGRGLRASPARQAPPLGGEDPPPCSPDKFLVSTEFLRALSRASPATTPGVGQQRVGFLPAEALAASSPDSAKGKGVRGPGGPPPPGSPPRGGRPEPHVRGLTGFEVPLFSSLPPFSRPSLFHPRRQTCPPAP